MEPSPNNASGSDEMRKFRSYRRFVPTSQAGLPSCPFDVPFHGKFLMAPQNFPAGSFVYIARGVLRVLQVGAVR
jgi:hypothetical protein